MSRPALVSLLGRMQVAPGLHHGFGDMGFWSKLIRTMNTRIPAELRAGKRPRRCPIAGAVSVVGA